MNSKQLLESIGLTESEAKVYLALCGKPPMSGYEASKVSMVPRSKIYNVLEALISKGFILYTEKKDGNLYRPVAFQEIAHRKRQEQEETLRVLEAQIQIETQEERFDEIWHLRGYQGILVKCQELLKHCQQEVLLQIWEEELPQLLPILVGLEAQNVRVGVVCFSDKVDLNLPLKHFCRHGMLQEKAQEMGGRFITLVVDQKQVIFGQLQSEVESEVIWTASKPMVVMAAEYVRHDLYFYKSAALMGPEMQRQLGTHYEKVRDIFV